MLICLTSALQQPAWRVAHPQQLAVLEVTPAYLDASWLVSAHRQAQELQSKPCARCSCLRADLQTTKLAAHPTIPALLTRPALHTTCCAHSVGIATVRQTTTASNPTTSLLRQPFTQGKPTGICHGSIYVERCICRGNTARQEPALLPSTQ